MLAYLLDRLAQWRYRDRITETHLAELLRHEDTRGVDLPTWRTPKELAQMRRLERREALRNVKAA